MVVSNLDLMKISVKFLMKRLKKADHYHNGL